MIKKNITINANYIEYNKKKGIAFIKGKSKTILENRYVLNSVDLYLDQNLNKIYSRIYQALKIMRVIKLTLINLI